MKLRNIEYAKKSLLGLSIGDAFGDSFFYDRDNLEENIDRKIIPSQTQWEFTDDTVMAIAIYKNLKKNGYIDQDELAFQFSENYKQDINRGYGGTAHQILREVGEGLYWKDVSSNVFDGQGSMGNGAAMRIAPLGAYYYDDILSLIKESKKSAVVTHSHHEAQVGAVAVAYAAALALRSKLENIHIYPNIFIQQVYDQLEDSDTKSKIGKSLHIPITYRMDSVTSILGNGIKLLAQDTVPLVIWCSAHFFSNFENALWHAVSALGDRDTICAMVGSIVILSAPETTIPKKWIDLVENIDNTHFI